MPGPPPKPADQRVRRNRDGGTTSTTVVLADGGGVAGPPEWAPAPRDVWLDEVAEEWEVRWEAPSAQMLQPEHVTPLRRLFDLYDEIERLTRAIRRPSRHPRLFADDVEPAEPVHRGGGWYELSDGRKVQGREQAVAVEEELAEERRWWELPGHLAVGSQGQIVEHPNARRLDRVRAEARAMEDRFGGSPMAYFRLGWQVAAAYNERARANEAAALAEAAARIEEQHLALLDGTAA